MTARPTAFFLMLLLAATTAACRRKPSRGPDPLASERTLVGRVLLPSGSGSRGVEVVMTTTEPGGEPRDTWLLFDERGRFEHPVRGRLTAVTVSTGLRAELHRIAAEGLPEVDRAGRIDVGDIDLRDRLIGHRVVIRAAVGAPPGDVRVALCFGLPPVGPQGERVALGSRQFPPVALGNAVDWLLPPDATSIHFLVERPLEAGDGAAWRSGRQRLFGPFTAATLPTALAMD